MKRLAAAILTWGLLTMGAGAAPAAENAGFVRRLESLALLQTLNADLLSHDSATAVLQDWCDAHGPVLKEGGGLKITAQRVRGQDKPPTDAARAALHLQSGQPVNYRRVRLACGERVLSEADNWYLPGRLTADMNRTLDGSDTPFGVVVRPLDFRRRNLSARLLYAPLPKGWEKGATDAAAPGPPPAEVLQHAAVLATPDGAPFSYVVETYTGQVLEMALPR
jgi:hypothetical protein